MSDILSRLSTGDPQAAQECIDRYGGLVWSLARRHSPTPADAEDAVQEIFLALWKNADRFDPARSSEPTFIAMIARRRLIDLHRRSERRPQTIELAAEHDVPGSGARQIEAAAEARIAERALAQLRPEERRAVLLSACHGMSHGEIAERTGLPLGTVKTYIRRGLERVRTTLRGAAELGTVGEPEPQEARP